MKDLNIQLKEEEELNNYKELMTKPEGTIFWVVNYKSQNLVKNNFLQVDGNYLNYFEYFEINRNLIKTNFNKPYFRVLTSYIDDISKIFFNEIEAKENFYNFLIEKDMDSMKESFFLSEENLELKNKFTKILIEKKIQKYNSELKLIQDKISYLQTKLNQ